MRQALRAEGFTVPDGDDLWPVLPEPMGACAVLIARHPQLAGRALLADPHAGPLLSCNVVVRSTPAGVLVEAADPVYSVRATEQDALVPVATEIHRLLTAALDRLRPPASGDGDAEMVTMAS